MVCVIQGLQEGTFTVKVLLPEHRWCEDTLGIAQFLIIILLQDESHF